MKALIQRVQEACVRVEGDTVGAISHGILVLLGVEQGDNENNADKLLHKLLHYRIFADACDKMNLNVQEVNGGVLIVSQFTLAADTQKGLRPSFSCAAAPTEALRLYDYFVQRAKIAYPNIATGQFAANMQVHLINDGPVTFLLEN